MSDEHRPMNIADDGRVSFGSNEPMSRLKEIKERLSKATPGKWKPNSNEGYRDRWLFIDQGDEIYVKDVDTQLIAHAPTDLRYLLDRVAKFETALKNIVDNTPSAGYICEGIARQALEVGDEP